MPRPRRAEAQVSRRQGAPPPKDEPALPGGSEAAQVGVVGPLDVATPGEDRSAAARVGAVQD